jgi:hypothetical protein
LPQLFHASVPTTNQSATSHGENDFRFQFQYDQSIEMPSKAAYDTLKVDSNKRARFSQSSF